MTALDQRRRANKARFAGAGDACQQWSFAGHVSHGGHGAWTLSVELPVPANSSAAVMCRARRALSSVLEQTPSSTFDDRFGTAGDAEFRVDAPEVRFHGVDAEVVFHGDLGEGLVRGELLQH